MGVMELPQDMGVDEHFVAFSWAQELAGCYLLTSKTNKDLKRKVIDLNTLRIALKDRMKSRDLLQWEIKRLVNAKVDAKASRYNCTMQIVAKDVAENKSSLYFKVMLEAKDYSLDTVVEVGAGYPYKLPSFEMLSISLKGSSENDNSFINRCKNMQIKLNTDEYKSKDLLLTTMIHRLQECFDIFVDAESNNGQTLEDSCKRVHRGRDRRYSYD